MDLSEVVELAIETLVRGGLEDDEVVTTLIEAGISRAIASRVLVFVPMAFAQAMLGGRTGATFGASYMVRSPDGSTTEHVLAEEPVFVEALAAAQRERAGADRLAVAARSAEFNAINKALHGGSELADLQLGSTVVWASSLPPFDAGDPPPISYAKVELPAPSSRLEQRLGEVLEAHGLRGVAGPSGYEVEGRIKVEGAVFSSRTGAGAFIVQLDVCVETPGLAGRMLVESCAGVGSTIDAAVHDGFSKFCRGALHPVLAALVDESLGHDQVEWETWTRGDEIWRVCMGPLLQQSSVPAAVDYAQFLDALRAQWLVDSPRATEPHWLRVWYMMGPEGRFGAEVLLDNDSWDAGVAVLDAARWPIVGETYALRHFMVLLPAGARASTGG